MRVFDAVGVIALLVWLVALGSFAFLAYDRDATGLTLTDGEIDLREETIFMTLYQSGEEVGILREDRTRLIDGWLIEMRGVITMDIFDGPRSFRLDTKTNVATDLSLRSTLGTLEAFGSTVRMDGRYREEDGASTFHLNLQFDNARRSFAIPLNERPFLIGHALPRMLASDDLATNSRFRQDYFDPLRMTPSSVTTVYEGREEITQFGETVNAHRFTHTQQGMDTTIFTDDSGSVLRQFMPLGVHMVRVPEIIGVNNFRSRNDSFESSKDDLPSFLRSFEPESLLGLLARGLGAASTDGDDQEFDFEEFFPSADIFSDLDLDAAPLEETGLTYPEQHEDEQ